MAIQPPKNASELALNVVALARRDRYCANEKGQKTPLLAQDIAKMAIPLFGRTVLATDALKMTVEYDALMSQGVALLSQCPEEPESKKLIERSIKVLHAMREERQVAAFSHTLLVIGFILLMAGACISGSIAHDTFHNVTTSSKGDLQFYLYGAGATSLFVGGGAYALWQHFLPGEEAYTSLQDSAKFLSRPVIGPAAPPEEEPYTSAGCKDVEEAMKRMGARLPRFVDCDRMVELASKYPNFNTRTDFISEVRYDT